MIGYSSTYSISVYKMHPTEKRCDLVFMLDDTYREVMEGYFDARKELIRR